MQLFSNPQIGISDIREALNSSCINDRGECHTDPKLFLEHLGSVVIDCFSRVRLIGAVEPREGRETYWELKRALRSISWTYFLSREGHAVISLYLVWTGIFCYGEEKGHELWPHVFEGLEFEDTQPNRNILGYLFKCCIDKNDLEPFKDIELSHHFVTLILLHGLIPLRHLKKFINELLDELKISSQPISGKSILNKWKRNKERFKYFPVPIKNFILYGDPVNSLLIDRFLDIATNWNKDPDNLGQWGLPSYMVEEFKKSIDQKHKRSAPKQTHRIQQKKPYIIFDFRDYIYPSMIIPNELSGEKLKLKTFDFDGLSKEKFISSFDDSPIEPAKKWEIYIYKSKAPIKSISNFLPQKNGHKVPIFAFDGNTHRLLSFEKLSTSNEIMLVYPIEASVSISQGQIYSEPIPLSDAWSRFNLSWFSLEGSSVLSYEGPDISFKTKVKMAFELKNKQESQPPTLKSDYKLPHWFQFHSIEPHPVFTDIECIEIYFPDGIPHYWRGARGWLKDQNNKSLSSLEFRIDEKSSILIASILHKFCPKTGIYELQIRGPLGVEDLQFPFVFIPLRTIKRLPENKQVKDRFLLEFSQSVQLKALNAEFEMNDDKKRFSLSMQGDDAFCKIRLDEKCPLTFYLARSDIRWKKIKRHCAKDPSIKDEISTKWTVFPETLSVQKIEEFYDIAVWVQIDSKEFLNRPPYLLLRSDDAEPRILKSSNLRRFKDIWLLQLKEFSSQLKYIDEVQYADIVIKTEDKEEYVLFQLQKYHEFKNFSVKTLQFDKKKEIIELDWSPQDSDPQNRRCLYYYPELSPESERLKVVNIEDKKGPPIQLEIPRADESGVWDGYIGIKGSRFAKKGLFPCKNIRLRQWFRTKSGWIDWIEWPDITPDEISAWKESFENVSFDIGVAAFPWLFFLDLFYNRQGSQSCHSLRRLLGESLIKVLPFFKGRLWKISGGDKEICLRVNSGIYKLPENFERHVPSEWGHILEGVELILLLMQDVDDKFLGKKGYSWRVTWDPRSEKTILVPPKELGRGEIELPIWIEDAIYPSEEGNLAAVMPLKIWYNLLMLPIQNIITQRDCISISQEKESEELVSQWKRWINSVYPNKTLKEVIIGCIHPSKPHIFLTGAYSFICRLNAHEYFDVPRTKTFENIYKRTGKFVSDYAPNSLLRDLILSELLISWYWEKRAFKLKSV